MARAFLRKYVGREVERARALGGSPASGDDQADVWTWRIDPTGALFTLEYPIENLRGAENAVV